MEPSARARWSSCRGAAATGAFDVFRQYNDLYYLCGVEVPNAYLTLDTVTGRSTLYLPRRDPKHEKSEGSQLSAEDAGPVRDLTGVEDLKPLEALPADLASARVVYTPFAPAEGRQACRDVLRHAAKANGADPLFPGGADDLFRERLARACPARNCATYRRCWTGCGRSRARARWSPCAAPAGWRRRPSPRR